MSNGKPIANEKRFPIRCSVERVQIRINRKFLMIRHCATNYKFFFFARAFLTSFNINFRYRIARYPNKANNNNILSTVILCEIIRELLRADASYPVSARINRPVVLFRRTEIKIKTTATIDVKRLNSPSSPRH